MDIYEALEKLDGFFDALANYGECTDEELELMGEIEDTIYQFARKNESSDVKMKYVIAEIDWDNCYADLIAAFDDRETAQEVLMEMWFEYQYRYFCEYLEYRWERKRGKILQEALADVPSLRYCNLIIMEVPDCGS